MRGRRLKGLLWGFLLLSGELFASCGGEALKLSDVQGKGAVSPLTGKTVTVEGVITLDSRQPDGWRGFYLQQTADRTDTDLRTSDALFVYTDRAGGSVGMRVRVTGQVKEYHGLTELIGVSDLTLCGPAPLPEAIPVQLPWPDQKPPEHLENMRVMLSQPLTLIGHHSFARYGELILADRPQVTPTEWLEPGPEARVHGRLQALNRLYLDDGKSAQNPRPLPWPAPLLADGASVRAGDRIAGLTGVLDYRFGHWRLQPTDQPQLLQAGSRPKPPPRTAAATLRVVTLNLGNFFNGEGDGFANGRGAATPAQFRRQTARLRSLLTKLDPDVIAAMEVENDAPGPASAAAELAQALGPDWQYVTRAGAVGTDAIRTELLYRNDRVQAVGPPQRLTRGTFARRGRPPVAQLFQPVTVNSSAVVRVVVPHFKSKACGGANGKDRDQDDGQGCYAHRRTEEASTLADWLRSLPQPDRFAGILVTGDLNSYAREWPLTQLENAGLTNLIRARHGCQPDSCPATTYRYRGRHGSLDHALGSDELLSRIVDAGVWPINAEEFPAIGYQGPIPVAPGTPWRSSDHNPLFIDLAL